MKQRFCRVCTGWHDPEAWPHNCFPVQEAAPSHLPAPMIMADTMDPVQSQLDGEMYDSKSKLRKTYRDAGVVEIGNDSSVTNPTPPKKPEPDRQAIKAAVGKAFSQVGLGA